MEPVKDNKTHISALKQYMIFQVEGEEYGVDIQDIISIITPVPATRVPKTPAYIKGVINLRGEIIPIMDLRERLNLPLAEITEEMRIIIFKIDEAPMGAIVDSVTEVVQLPPDSVESSAELARELVSGIAKLEGRIITLLDLNRLVDMAKKEG